MAYVVWHAQDEAGKPVVGAIFRGIDPVTNRELWASEASNPCGDCRTHLSPGKYRITVEAPGRLLRVAYNPATIGVDGGEIAALVGASSGIAPVAPRIFRGQMCGIRLLGAPPVDGGAADASLILSWFYSRYPSEWRAQIRAAYLAHGYPDVLVSWTDDRAAGISAADHVSHLQELCADGLRPCEMLSSKAYCPRDDASGTLAIINEVLPLLVGADCVSRYCVGWEMNLWNTYDSLQGIIDAVAVKVVPKRPLSVHFSPGYADWRPDHKGSTFADFWNPNIGKLSGLWHQAVSTWSDADYQARLADVLARFAGGFNVSPDSGFGHPFDCSAVEISAQEQFNGTMTEAMGNARAQVALRTPAASGPFGRVSVQGSGNGGE